MRPTSAHRGHPPVILDPAGPGMPIALWYEPHGSLSEAAVVATDGGFVGVLLSH